MAGVGQPVVIRSPSAGRARCFTPQGNTGRLSPGPARRGLQASVAQASHGQSQHCLRQQTCPQALVSSPRAASVISGSASCAMMPDTANATANAPGFMGARMWSTPQMQGLSASARSDIRLQVAGPTPRGTHDDMGHVVDDGSLQKVPVASATLSRSHSQQPAFSWCPPATARACGPGSDSTVSWCPPVTARGEPMGSWCPPPIARGLECSTGGMPYAGSSPRPQSPPPPAGARGHHSELQASPVCSPLLDAAPLSVRARSPVSHRPVGQLAPPARMPQAMQSPGLHSPVLASSPSYSPPPLQQTAIDTQVDCQQQQLQQQHSLQQQQEQQQEQQQQRRQQRQQSEPFMPAASSHQPALATSASQPASRAASPSPEDVVFSPRDTVWKRYFSPRRCAVGQPGPARPRDSPALQARLIETSRSQSAAPLPTVQCIPASEAAAGPMASPQLGATNFSPMGIPRLPLDNGVSLPVGSSSSYQPECMPTGHELPPTVRNHMGHESRPLHSQSLSHSIRSMDVQVVDPDTRQASDTTAHSLLTQAGDPQAQWSTPTLPPMSARDLYSATSARTSDPNSRSVRTIVPDSGAGLSETTSSLARMMGHFGPPEPPTAMQGLAGSLTQAHVAHAEVSALPDEYEKQSFVVATTPFLFAQGESFLHPSAHAAEEALKQKTQPSQTSTQGGSVGSVPLESHTEEISPRAASEDGARGEANIHEKAADDIERAFMEEGQEAKPLLPRRRAVAGSSGASHVSDSKKEGGPERSPSRGTPSRQASASSRQRQRPAAEKAAEHTGAPAPPAGDELSIAVAAISSRDIAELRSFRNPPAVVSQVLEAVAVLVLGPHGNALRLRRLMDHGLLTKLRAVNPSQVTMAQSERLKALLAAPPFSDGALPEKCPAAVSLANWCVAVDRSMKQSSADPARVAVLRPDLDGLRVEPDLWSLTEGELSCVHGLRFSRDGVGSVAFHGETDCRELLDHILDIIVLQPGEVVVYPNAGTKPPIGKGLNKPADITLCGCMPKTPGFKDRKAKQKYKHRVRQMTEDKGAEFIDYDVDCGVWQFRVKHF